MMQSKINVVSFPIAKSGDDNKTASPEAQKDGKPSLSDECVIIGNKCAEIAAKGGLKAWILKKIV